MKSDDVPSTKIQAIEDEFIDLWNNMASLWGISPTMAQIHGLLFITGEAMSMDDIMSRLKISRGNVSMNLSKLVEWGLVRKVRKRGDRKEFYESLSDVWEMFTLVATQRKRREIDPVLNTLRRCRQALEPTNDSEPKPVEIQARFQRIDELFQFLVLMETLAKRFFENQEGLKAAVELLAGNKE